MSFRFKQFFVDDSRCAMKVGTDGVLLGAWAKVKTDECRRIADIGAGSGLVSLMMAQRYSEAIITGIEIDPAAAEQAQANFLSSPWADRLSAECCPVQQYAPLHNGEFDMVVSNPPFFSNSLKAPDAARTAARHTDMLTLEELVNCSSVMLKEKGCFSVVLPVWEEERILCCAANFGLALNRIMRVQGRTDRPVKRLLLSFLKTTEKQTVEEDSLVLETDINVRTQAYSLLMQDFYL
ncbi:MAG: methyltransferase [Paludibacteraceae bacterium]|nr:methyltransferase [Paludibacteraceae bacterium]